MEQPGSGARKAAKRALCPFINGRIIAIADEGDFWNLVETVRHFLPDMNLVNLTTSLHRLVKLAPKDLSCMQQPDFQEVLGGVLHNIRGVLVQLDSATPSRCQTLSNILWSLAVLQYPCEEIVVIILRLAGTNLLTFQPFELASSLWALSRLGKCSQTIREIADPLFEQAVPHFLGQVGQYNTNCLVMIISAFSTAEFYRVQVFQSAARRLESILKRGHFQPSAIPTLISAFLPTPIRNQEFLEMLARKAIKATSTLTTQEIVESIVGLAEAKICVWDFYAEAFRVLLSRPGPFVSSQFTSLVRSMWLVRDCPGSITDFAVLGMLPLCTKHVDVFDSEDYACLLGLITEAIRPRLQALRREGSRGGPPHLADFLQSSMRSFSDKNLLSVCSDTALGVIIRSLLSGGLDVNKRCGQQNGFYQRLREELTRRAFHMPQDVYRTLDIELQGSGWGCCASTSSYLQESRARSYSTRSDSSGSNGDRHAFVGQRTLPTMGMPQVLPTEKQMPYPFVSSPPQQREQLFDEEAECDELYIGDISSMPFCPERNNRFVGFA